MNTVFLMGSARTDKCRDIIGAHLEAKEEYQPGLRHAGEYKRGLVVSVAIKDWFDELAGGIHIREGELKQLLVDYRLMLDIDNDTSLTTIYLEDQVVEWAAIVWQFLDDYKKRYGFKVKNIRASRGPNMRMVYWLALCKMAKKVENENRGLGSPADS